VIPSYLLRASPLWNDALQTIGNGVAAMDLRCGIWAELNGENPNLGTPNRDLAVFIGHSPPP
jgi:hypothetical protein